MKEEEIEKGDCGPPTRKVFFEILSQVSSPTKSQKKSFCLCKVVPNCSMKKKNGLKPISHFLLFISKICSGKKSGWLRGLLGKGQESREPKVKCPKANTNALVVELGRLADEPQWATGDAVRCHGCNAVLSAVSELKPTPSGSCWKWYANL